MPAAAKCGIRASASSELYCITGVRSEEIELSVATGREFKRVSPALALPPAAILLLTGLSIG